MRAGLGERTFGRSACGLRSERVSNTWSRPGPWALHGSLAAFTPPGAEDREDLVARARGDGLVRDMADGANRLAHLLQVGSAAIAGIEMALGERALVRWEHVLQVRGHQLDKLTANDLVMGQGMRGVMAVPIPMAPGQPARSTWHGGAGRADSSRYCGSYHGSAPSTGAAAGDEGVSGSRALAPAALPHWLRVRGPQMRTTAAAVRTYSMAWTTKPRGSAPDTRSSVGNSARARLFMVCHSSATSRLRPVLL